MTPLAPLQTTVAADWLAATSANPEAIGYAADHIAAGLSFGVAGYADLEPGDMTYYPIIVTTLGPEMGLRQGATHVVAVPNLHMVAAIHLGEPGNPALVFPEYLGERVGRGVAAGSVIVLAAVLTELAQRLHGRI